MAENKEIKVLLIEPVTMDASTVDEGEVIVLPEKSAQALVAEGKAEFAEEGQDGGTDPVDPPSGTTATTQNEQGENNAELIAKALESQYTRDELAEKAKEVGVQFAYNATKPKLIEAVINQGFADALLKSAE